MTNPWIAGFGKAISGLGSDLQTRSLIEDQKRRQVASNALNRLLALQQVGGTEIPDGVDPSSVLQSAQSFNTMRSGGAIPNEALGIPDESVPDAFGSPRLVRLPSADGKSTINIVVDPSKTPQALAERRLSLQQSGLDRRQQSKLDAAAAIEADKEKARAALAQSTQDAKTLAGTKAARADYNTLKSLNPKHPLVAQPFDPDNAANYGNALRFEEQKQIQASAYHPEARAKYGSFVNPKDPSAQPVFIPEDEASRLGLVPSPKTGAGAGQNAPQMAAAKANLDAAMQIMDEYEGKLKQGKAKYGILGGTEGALASSPVALNAKGPLGAVESLLANAASSRLQTSNPDLARYLTAKKYVAEAILNTHKRPNQTQYEIEQEISGAGPNASPEQIDMAADRRRRMKAEVFDNPNAGAVTAPGGVSGGIPRAPSATSGDIDLRGGGRPPLAERVIQLKAQGLSKEAARAQLAKEGYQLTGTP